MKWRIGDTYRCCNTSCECEVTITEPPRPTGTAQQPMPSCCACGNPMYKKEAPEVQPTQPN